ncbi:hypothetical protein Q9L58_010945, partial [Maublancomyces gigas]
MYSNQDASGFVPSSGVYALAGGEPTRFQATSELPRNEGITRRRRAAASSITSSHVAPASHVLIELHNHAHLRAVYGESSAAQAVNALWQQARFLGGDGIVLPPNRFLVKLSAATTAEMVAPLTESWQLSLGAVVLPCGANQVLPEVAVTAVTGAEGICSHVAPLMTSARGGLAWVLDYERDMRAALALHRALAQDRMRLVFRPVVRRERLGVGRGEKAVLYHKAFLHVRDELDEFAPRETA